MVDGEEMARNRAGKVQQKKEEVYAVLQHEGSFH